MPLLPICKGKIPGGLVCKMNTVLQCGPDLVTSPLVETCPNVCSNGVCTTCTPTTMQCAGMNAQQTCGADGQWGSPSPCPEQTPQCSGAGVCGAPPSCAQSDPTAAVNTCGPGANESCCTSLLVTGGTYNRSNDASSPATVSDFRLDRFEITVSRFRQFLAGYPGNKPKAGDGAHLLPAIANSGWDLTWDASLTAGLAAAASCTDHTYTPNAGTNAREDRPMNCLSWYTAFAFCAWDGGYLPTEAEWDYVAVAGTEQRVFPWTPPQAMVILNSSHAVYCPGMTPNCTVTNILSVGSKSPLGDARPSLPMQGQADMIGGVWEWTLDWYAGYVSPCVDCANTTSPSGPTPHRASRGGSWAQNALYQSSTLRNPSDPAMAQPGSGARCARPY